MTDNIKLNNGIDNVFGVRHYSVKVISKKEGTLKYIISVLSYALFIFLLLVGGLMLVYIADIKIRASKGDYSAPVFNAYVVLSGSMLPTIQIKDIVITKKISSERLNVGDIITFIAPDERYHGISITHRIIEKYYDPLTEKYSYKTKGDNNNIADETRVPNDNVLGKVILKVPKLGFLQDIIASKGGVIIFILIPSLAILSYDMVKIVKKIGKRTNLIKE